MYNDSLLNQKDFDHDLVSLLSSFLCRLEPPVCLISHNGFRFDFPLLKAELGSIGCDLPEGILCLDTWEMFRSLDGCPVPDSSHFLMPSQRMAVQSKKTHAASGIPLGSIKRKKKAETKSSADTEGEKEMISCVRQLFHEDETQTSECDAKRSQTVSQTENISSLSVTSATILVSESTAALPVVKVADALENAVLDGSTTSVAKSQTCGLMTTENSSSFIVESGCNMQLILNDHATDHLALNCTVGENSESFLQDQILCSVSSKEKTSAVVLGISPALSMSPSNKDENKVLKSSILSVIPGNLDDKSITNVMTVKPNLDDTAQILPCNVGISESVAAIELPSLAVKSDAKSCIFNSITNSLKEIDKECDIAEEEIANEGPLLNLIPPFNVPVISDSESSLSCTASQNFTNTTMVIENRETDIKVKEHFNRHNRNNFPQKRFSYRLAEIHYRVVGCYPSGSHRAEDDCVALARIFMFTPNSTQWADSHAVPFAAFRPLYCSPHKHLQPGVFPSHLN